MNEQRQHGPRQRALLPGAHDSEPSESDQRLAAAREQLRGIYAAADAILDDIRLANNERFLEQARQSGGQ